MAPAVEIRTERLRLRRWVASDRAAFAALNRDPTVTEFLPAPITRDDSDAMASRVAAHFAEHGFGLFAIEVPGVTPFAGFAGLSTARFPAPFTPCIEIGWRLAAEHWGHGYATEAAVAVRGHGFGALSLDEIVSFSVPGNQRSRRVMERIGMQRDLRGDFDHPSLPTGHALRRHVLYRLPREQLGLPTAAPDERASRA